MRRPGDTVTHHCIYGGTTQLTTEHRCMVRDPSTGQMEIYLFNNAPKVLKKSHPRKPRRSLPPSHGSRSMPPLRNGLSTLRSSSALGFSPGSTGAWGEGRSMVQSFADAGGFGDSSRLRFASNRQEALHMKRSVSAMDGEPKAYKPPRSPSWQPRCFVASSWGSTYPCSPKGKRHGFVLPRAVAPTSPSSPPLPPLEQQGKKSTRMEEGYGLRLHSTKENPIKREEEALRIAELLMADSEGGKRCGELSLTELTAAFKGVKWRPFTHWMIDDGMKNWRVFDADRGGSIELDELEEAIGAYLEETLGPEVTPQKKQIENKEVERGSMLLEFHADSRLIITPRCPPPSVSAPFGIAKKHQPAQALPFVTMRVTTAQASMEAVFEKTLIENTYSLRSEICVPAAVKDNTGGSYADITMEIRHTSDSPVMASRTFSGPMALGPLHLPSQDISLTPTDSDIVESVEMECNVRARALGRFAYPEASEQLQPGQIMLRVELKHVEFCLPHGNPDSAPPESFGQFRDLPKFTVWSIGKSRQCRCVSKDVSALFPSPGGWSFLYNDPLYLPVTLYLDPHSDDGSFLSKFVTIEVMTPGNFQMVCSHRFDVAEFTNMDDDRALVDFEFFGEGKKYRPRGQLTVEVVHRPKKVEALLEDLALSTDVAEHKDDEGIAEQAKDIGIVQAQLTGIQFMGLSEELQGLSVSVEVVPGPVMMSQMLRSVLPGNPDSVWACNPPQNTSSALRWCAQRTAVIDDPIALHMSLDSTLRIELYGSRAVFTGSSDTGGAKPLPLHLASMECLVGQYLDEQCRSTHVNHAFTTTAKLADSPELFMTFGLRFSRNNRPIARPPNHAPGRPLARIQELKPGQLVLQLTLMGASLKAAPRKRGLKLVRAAARVSRRGMTQVSELVQRVPHKDGAVAKFDFAFEEALFIPVTMFEAPQKSHKYQRKIVFLEILSATPDTKVEPCGRVELDISKHVTSRRLASGLQSIEMQGIGLCDGRIFDLEFELNLLTSDEEVEETKTRLKITSMMKPSMLQDSEIEPSGNDTSVLAEAMRAIAHTGETLQDYLRKHGEELKDQETQFYERSRKMLHVKRMLKRVLVGAALDLIVAQWAENALRSSAAPKK